MSRQHVNPRHARALSRRELLHAGLAAGLGFSTWPLAGRLWSQDAGTRKQLIFAIQRYVAEQQYYVYLNSNTITTSWQPYVKNFAPNHSFDYGNRAAALWLDR